MASANGKNHSASTDTLTMSVGAVVFSNYRKLHCSGTAIFLPSASSSSIGASSDNVNPPWAYPNASRGPLGPLGSCTPCSFIVWGHGASSLLPPFLQNFLEGCRCSICPSSGSMEQRELVAAQLGASVNASGGVCMQGETYGYIQPFSTTSPGSSRENLKF